MHIVVHDSSFTCRFCNLIKKWSTFPNPPFQSTAIKKSLFTIQLKHIEIKSHPTSYLPEIYYTAKVKRHSKTVSCWLQHCYGALCISMPMKQTLLFLYDLIFFVIYRPLRQTHQQNNGCEPFAIINMFCLENSI